MEYMRGILKIIYRPPPNLFVSAMSVVSAVSLANVGLSEIRGNNLKYSKFFVDGTNKQIKLSSKNGMLLAYSPAFLAGLTSFALFPNQGFKFLLLKSALTFHFFKRLFEVLFIHKYSGGMELETTIPISLSYCLSTETMIYSQYLIQGYPNPEIDLTYPGIVLYLIGISGNFYHHYILSKLRTTNNNNKEYKIPKGGLFDLVICPHYLFEILIFWGIFLISQTVYAFSFASGTTLYLMARSYATKRWYVSKFEDFPKNVKSLIPFVF